MTQLSLSSALRQPMIVRPVDPYGHVLQEEPHTVFELPHQRRITAAGRIELHPAAGGLWMWSASFNTGTTGNSYRVGEKWGHFAASAEDALHYAVEELRGRLSGLGRGGDRMAWRILDWAESLTLEAVHA